MSSFNPDTYLSYVNDTTIAAVKSLQTSYQTQIASAKSSIEKLDFSGWTDDIATKLSNHCDSLKNTYYSAIEKDVGTGNLTTLVTSLEGLKAKCEEYKTLKNQSVSYPSGLSDFAKDYLAGKVEGPLTEADQNLVEVYESRKRAKQRKLDECQNTIETILRNIKAITFSETGEKAQLENVDLSSSDGSTGEGEATTTTITSYYDSYTGEYVNATMTIEVVDGQQITTLKVTYSDEEGNVQREETQQYIVDVENPKNATFIEADGEIYSTEVQSDGTLLATNTYTDKHNEPQPNSYEIGETYYTLTVYDHETGETTAYNLNVESDADMAFMRMIYGNARMAEGYSADYRFDGVHHLGMTDDGGGSVTIEAMFTDTPSATTVSLRPGIYGDGDGDDE